MVNLSKIMCLALNYLIITDYFIVFDYLYHYHVLSISLRMPRRRCNKDHKSPFNKKKIYQERPLAAVFPASLSTFESLPETL